MKFLNWLLYQVHRWLGVAVGLFMFFWFFTGLVIIYSPSLNQSRTQQLAHAESLSPQVHWLSLGEVWQRSAEERKALADESKPKANAEAMGQHGGGEATANHQAHKPVSIVDARLQSIANQPVWLVEDSRGKRFALSALDGSVLKVSAEQAVLIAKQWAKAQGFEGDVHANLLETIDSSIFLRNQEALKPFHKIAVADNGQELLVSSRTGEVLHASTPVGRAFYLSGNWLHLLKPLTLLGFENIRHDVQLWTGFIATIASITGLIIGWIRWRPGFGGKRTYSQGRTQPYREFWFKWHFWSGLIGGTLALLWALSGYLDTNPGKIFSAGEVSKDELARYIGDELPPVIANWQPATQIVLSEAQDVVELSWRRLGGEAVLLAYSRDGQRWPQVVEGAAPQFVETSLLSAVQRVNADAPIAKQTLLNQYDSYYYPRHNQGQLERPLPVLKVELADQAGTHFYLDPQDGRLLAKLDSSRRLFRWVYTAIHHWDFGWLYYRPVWDVWMLTWIGFGLVLGLSSVILGWRRLKVTVLPKKQPAKAAKVGAPILAD